jgi:Lon protease-like protein
MMTAESQAIHRAGEEISDLAIFPLNTVLFPSSLLPLRVFEQRYMDMAKRCLKEDEPFGVCLIRSGREVGAPATPETVGCTARIIDWDMQQLGVLSIRVRGEQRFRIRETLVTDAGLTRARVELLAPDSDVELPAAFCACADLLRSVVAEHGEEIFADPLRFDSCAWVGARLADILPLSMPAKQGLLELDDVRQRVEILHALLAQGRLLDR